MKKIKTRQALALVTSTALLLGLTACGDSSGNTSSQSSEQKTNPSAIVASIDDTAPISEDTLAKMSYQQVEDISDVTAQGLELTGNYVQLTDMAKAAFSGETTTFTSIDMEDGSIIFITVSAIDAGGGAGIQLKFIHINAADGSLLGTATCDLPHALNAENYTQWEDIRGKEGYPEGMDLMVQTSLGAFLFDLDDLSKDPTVYSYQTTDFGELTVKSTDGTVDSAHFMNKTYDVQNNKIVYANNDGVYVANPDGSNAEKIADQPAARNWFELYQLEDKPSSENQNAIYANFRLFDNGTKAVSEIVNYEQRANTAVGIAIFDLENKTVKELGFFTSDSALSGLDGWKTLASYNISDNIGYVDDQTFAILVSGADKESVYGDVRWDILVNVTSSEVTRDLQSPTGITTNYISEAVNDYYKSDSGKCTLFNMETGEYEENDLGITTAALGSPVGISSKYALFNVWVLPETTESTASGTNSYGDPSKGQYYLVPTSASTEVVSQAE